MVFERCGRQQTRRVGYRHHTLLALKLYLIGGGIRLLQDNASQPERGRIRRHGLVSAGSYYSHQATILEFQAHKHWLEDHPRKSARSGVRIGATIGWSEFGHIGLGDGVPALEPIAMNWNRPCGEM